MPSCVQATLVQGKHSWPDATAESIWRGYEGEEDKMHPIKNTCACVRGGIFEAIAHPHWLYSWPKGVTPDVQQTWKNGAFHTCWHLGQAICNSAIFVQLLSITSRF